MNKKTLTFDWAPIPGTKWLHLNTISHFRQQLDANHTETFRGINRWLCRSGKVWNEKHLAQFFVKGWNGANILSFEKPQTIFQSAKNWSRVSCVYFAWFCQSFGTYEFWKLEVLGRYWIPTVRFGLVLPPILNPKTPVAHTSSAPFSCGKRNDADSWAKQ